MIFIIMDVKQLVWGFALLDVIIPALEDVIVLVERIVSMDVTPPVE